MINLLVIDSVVHGGLCLFSKVLVVLVIELGTIVGTIVSLDKFLETLSPIVKPFILLLERIS